MLHSSKASVAILLALGTSAQAPADDAGLFGELARVFEPGVAACGTSATARQSIRLGRPANPAALRFGVQSDPVVGRVWDPVIDHADFAPNAVLDVLAITETGVNMETPFGTLLADLRTDTDWFFAEPGQPFAVEVPLDCTLVGGTPCAQGGSYLPGGGIALTNAIDLVVGTR